MARRLSPEIEAGIARASRSTGLPPETLRAFVLIESGGRPDVQTGSYRGLLQLSPGDSHRRAMRVHMRAGHARNQACGQNRVDRHVVYIQPVLVNYRPGDEVPVPQRVVKR